MNNAFVFCTTDLHLLEHQFLFRLEEEPILCWAPRQVPKLQDAGVVYFVFSETCVGSSVFQDLVVSAFAATEAVPRWIIRLNDAVVPQKAKSTAAIILRSLPDGKPDFTRRPVPI